MAVVADVTIERGVSYPKDEFCRRAGVKRAGWKSLLRRGLTVRYVGGRAHVLGDDWLDFLATLADTEYPPPHAD